MQQKKWHNGKPHQLIAIDSIPDDWQRSTLQTIQVVRVVITMAREQVVATSGDNKGFLTFVNNMQSIINPNPSRGTTNNKI